MFYRCKMRDIKITKLRILQVHKEKRPVFIKHVRQRRSSENLRLNWKERKITVSDDRCLLWDIKMKRQHTETSTLPVKGCRFDLYSALMAIAQWGSLTCHAYYDIWHLFIMVISVDSCHSHLLQRSAVKLSSLWCPEKGTQFPPMSW